jgi:hypothetical protein
MTSIEYPIDPFKFGASHTKNFKHRRLVTKKNPKGVDYKIETNQFSNTKYLTRDTFVLCSGPCKRYVPSHVTQNNCFYCAKMKLRAGPTNVFVLCSGHCNQFVPPHVTQKTCFHCAKMTLCEGPCGKYIMKGTQTCYYCDLILFPYQKCATDSCNNSIRRAIHCADCLNKQKIKLYMDGLCEKFGEFDPDKQIVIRFWGFVEYGFGKKRIEVTDISLPVFKSIVPLCSSIQGSSNYYGKPIKINRFKRSPQRISSSERVGFDAIQFYLSQSWKIDGNWPQITKIKVISKTDEAYGNYKIHHDIYDMYHIIHRTYYEDYPSGISM